MRLYRSGSTQRRKPSRFGRIIKWMVICVVLTGLYGAVISPRRVEVAHHDVVLANLPSELGGLRVAQITDLHIGPLFREGSVRRIVRSTNELDPDIVVLTGDFTNFRSTRYILSATKELGALRSRHGVYACLGNHDYWEDACAVRRTLRASTRQGPVKREHRACPSPQSTI